MSATVTIVKFPFFIQHGTRWWNEKRKVWVKNVNEATAYSQRWMAETEQEDVGGRVVDGIHQAPIAPTRPKVYSY